MAKYILGLDLGPNSIGWAVVEGVEQEEHVGLVPQRIVMSGSRIIPIDKTTLSNFETGNTVSQTADRTQKRGMRRNLERKKLRRQRLFRVLKTMAWAIWTRMADGCRWPGRHRRESALCSFSKTPLRRWSASSPRASRS